MSRIFAIASLAIRNAIRSRMVICLLLVLLAVIFILPATVKGDGTSEGHAQIILNYTLGAAQFLLSLAILWAGCAAVAAEIEEKQIQMIVSKPVRAIHIWIGKWLGLSLLAAFLLAMCGGATYALLRAKIGADFARLRDSALAARETILPALPDVEPRAVAIFEEQRRAGNIAADVNPADAVAAIRENLLRQSFVAAPGGMIRWTLHIPNPPPRVMLRYRIAASRLDLARVAGQWSSESARSEITVAPNAWQETNIAIPPTPELTLTFANTDSHGATLLFDPHDGLQVLRPAGTFVGNFVRSLLVVFIGVAFLAALGITAGAIFSMPVAGLVSLYGLVLLRIGDYIGNLTQTVALVPWHQSEASPPNWVDGLLRGFFRLLHAFIAPLQSADPLGKLSGGELVSWNWVAHEALVKWAIYGVLLAWCGAAALRRRELALPT